MMGRRSRLAAVLAAVLLLPAVAPPSAGAAKAGAPKTSTRKTASKPVKKKAGPRKAPAKKAPAKKKVVGLDLPPLPPGRSCYQAGAEVPEPALLKDARIGVPEKARGGALKSALLVYQVLVDKTGRIAEVKTVGPQPKEVPWPQLHEAAIGALKKYKYAKTVVRGRPSPVCLMVSLNMDLR